MAFESSDGYIFHYYGKTFDDFLEKVKSISKMTNGIFLLVVDLKGMDWEEVMLFPEHEEVEDEGIVVKHFREGSEIVDWNRVILTYGYYPRDIIRRLEHKTTWTNVIGGVNE